MTDYRKLTYTDSKIQVDSAIRDGNGVRIDTNYQRKPAVYERTTQSSTSTTCTLIQFNASDYKANGYLAHFRFRVRSVLQDAYPSDNEFIINYSYRTASLMCTNTKKTSTNNIVRYIYAYYPSSNTYLDTGNYFIAFRTGRASTNFIIEMIEADVPYTIPATMSASTTTNTLYQSLSPGDYSSGTPLMWTDTAVGNISGNAATAVNSTYAHGTKQMYFRVGESDLFKLMAVDHTGVAYKINTSTKKFSLPISMYVGTGDGANATSNNGQTSISGSQGYTDVSYLTGSSYNGFTMPTLTTSDGGKTLYIRGSLDADGYFVCDGNVTLSMEAGYTYIPFGTLNPKYSGTTAQVPLTYSFNAISAPAYTLDANGKLTHIDGKPLNSSDPSTLYRATINDNQKIDAAWTEKYLVCTTRGSYDQSYFTPTTNGVQVNRTGLYLVSMGVGFRGGDGSAQQMIGRLRHRRNSVTQTVQNVRTYCSQYDSDCNLTLFVYAEGGDDFTASIDGTSANLVTMFQPDEGYFNVTYIGGSSRGGENITISSSAPSGGSNGDIWIQY